MHLPHEVGLVRHVGSEAGPVTRPWGPVEGRGAGPAVAEGGGWWGGSLRGAGAEHHGRISGLQCATRDCRRQHS